MHEVYDRLGLHSECFTARFGERAFRFVNDADTVTQVSPPVLIVPLLFYSHVESLRSIAADGSVGTVPFSISTDAGDDEVDPQRVRRRHRPFLASRRADSTIFSRIGS